MNKIFYFLFILSIPLYSQMKFEFDGQLMGQSNVSTSKNTTTFIGTRYLPVLNFNTKSDSILSAFSIEISGNLNFSRLSIPNKEIEIQSSIDPYRIWLRYQINKWEFRAGLQKIDFGVAQLLRPIQWFNQIDPRDPLGLTNGVYGLLVRHYFKNNSNLWFWGLYGNEKQRGFDALPTIKNMPEYGGRFQTFVPKGEAAISYNFRKAGLIESNNLSGYETPEHRIGFDLKLDLGFGLWTETTYIHKLKNIGLLTNQFLLNLGIDYTFAIGNGLTFSKEYLYYKSMDNELKESINRGISALNLSYPLNIFSSLNALVYHQWNNNNQTFLLNYQHQFNNLSGFLIFYYNPDVVQGIQQNEIFRSFAGPGIQLLLVYNH